MTMTDVSPVIALQYPPEDAEPMISADRLLPLVDATVPVYPDMKEPAIPGYQEILALSSVMLGYPDDELCNGRSEIVSALDAVPSSHPKTCLEHFARWWKDADPGQMRIHYVTTFDTRRGSALYVTYASCRDTALRGPALHAMKQLYTSYGYRPTEEELPDYLPTVCQFAALAPAEGALQALAMSYAGVEEIRDSLAAQKSPYSHILDAIASIIEKGVRP